MGRLDGKVAIVTGAGTGIGQASALKLAVEGARLVLAGRQKASLQKVMAQIVGNGGNANFQVTDVEIEDQARGLVHATLIEHGRIDILVNSAGYPARARSVRWVKTDAWDQALRVNLTGPYFLVQEVLHGMIERGTGTIITVASMAALRGSVMGGAAYAAAKAGVVNLMRQINLELHDKGVRACSILPGEVDTPILNKRPLPPDDEARSSMMKPEDVASAVLLCATMPDRTRVEEIRMGPTVQRDASREIQANMMEGAPSDT